MDYLVTHVTEPVLERNQLNVILCITPNVIGFLRYPPNLILPTNMFSKAFVKGKTKEEGMFRALQFHDETPGAGGIPSICLQRCK